jgi:hypothetical protein
LGISERIIDISIISYGKKSLDLRPTWVTTSPRERIEFVSQGSTVFVFVALGIQHAVRRHRILSTVACTALQYFSTLSDNQHDFRQNCLNVKYVLISFTNFAWNISYYKKKWAAYDKKYILVLM